MGGDSEAGGDAFRVGGASTRRWGGDLDVVGTALRSKVVYCALVLRAGLRAAISYLELDLEGSNCEATKRRCSARRVQRSVGRPAFCGMSPGSGIVIENVGCGMWDALRNRI